MDVTPLIREGQQVIQSYGAGVFLISSVSYDHAVFVFPDKTEEWKYGRGITVQNFSDLSIESFEPLIERADDIDVVLLGTGSKMEFFEPRLKRALSAKGLSIDVMDTGAACRTYNVLMAEGRRVVAALLTTES